MKTLRTSGSLRVDPLDAKVDTTDGRLSDSRTPTGSATGDLTGTYPGPTLGARAVTKAKLFAVTTARILGRTTAGSGDAEELTGSQVAALLPDAATSVKGLVTPPGGTSTFYRADGSFAAPAGGGGVGVLDPPQVGSYIQAFNYGTATQTSAAGLRLASLTFGTSVTLGAIYVNCLTASAGSVVRVGLYADSGGFPAGRLASWGTASLASTGYASVSCAGQVLAANTKYWVAVAVEGGATVAAANGLNPTQGVTAFAIPSTLAVKDFGYSSGSLPATSFAGSLSGDLTTPAFLISRTA